MGETTAAATEEGGNNNEEREFEPSKSFAIGRADQGHKDDDIVTIEGERYYQLITLDECSSKTAMGARQVAATR